jgi:hypothetical protein
MQAKLYTDGLTVKSVFPMLNEECLVSNFRVIEDRLFGVETLKTLVYEQARSYSSLQTKTDAFSEQLVKMEGRVNYRFANLEKIIEHEKQETRALNATNAKNIAQLFTFLD